MQQPKRVSYLYSLARKLRTGSAPGAFTPGKSKNIFVPAAALQVYKRVHSDCPGAHE